MAKHIPAEQASEAVRRARAARAATQALARQAHDVLRRSRELLQRTDAPSTIADVFAPQRRTGPGGD